MAPQLAYQKCSPLASRQKINEFINQRRVPLPDRPAWTESGRKTTTIPANPASVTATCAAMPRASLGCIAMIKGEHGQEIKAQIHALLNQQLSDEQQCGKRGC
jgi:hypothetical protein